MYGWRPQYGGMGGTVSGCDDGSDASLTGMCADGTFPVYGPSTPIPTGTVYGPTDAQLGTTPQAVANAVAAANASGSLSTWLNANASTVMIGSMLFVGLLVIGSGKRR